METACPAPVTPTPAAAASAASAEPAEPARGKVDASATCGPSTPTPLLLPAPAPAPAPTPTPTLAQCEEDLLPTASSHASCHFNGQQLKLSLGMLEYAGGRELFLVEGCTLECGHVFALVGPNGVGKTSFAKLVASKSLPGFPQSLSTCYVDCHVSSTGSELTPGEFLQRDVDLRCRELKAQQELLEARLDSEEDGATEEEVEAAAARLGGLYEQEEELLASTKSEIAGVLAELGFEAAPGGLLATPVGSLSSGWRYKCELASALLSHADLVVLDEPSFLDGASMRWLVERTRAIARDNGAMVMLITHKERLLDELADRVLFVSAAGRLETYNCGWAAFKEARRGVVVHSTKEASKGQAKQANAKQSLKQVQARLTKGEKATAKMVAGRKVDRRFVKGKSKEAQQKGDRSLAAKGKQLAKDAEALDELRSAAREHQVCGIPLAGSGWADTRQMISAQAASFTYRPEPLASLSPRRGQGAHTDAADACADVDADVEAKAEVAAPLLRDVSLAVYGGDRIALTGANGQGKSTLVQLLLGRVQPTAGAVHRSSGLRVAYFPQDALQRLAAEHGRLSASQLLQQRCDVAAVEARVHLGRFGLKGDVALQPIRTLSAGQRTRLFLALEFLPGAAAPSLLVLDEVENLDADTTEALLASLRDFDGAVLCVSHDEAHLLHFKPRQLWTVDNGHVHVQLT